MTPSDFFPLPELSQDLQRLEQWLSSCEATHPGIRPNNQARIMWHDPSQFERTRYTVVYPQARAKANLNVDACDATT